MILSGEMMLRYLGWNEAADLIIKGMDGAITDAHRHLRLRPPDEAGRANPTELKCSEFGQAIIKNM